MVEVEEADEAEEEEVVDDGGDGQNWAFLTFEMLMSTLKGVTFPTTVTFFVARSMLNDVTPVQNQHQGVMLTFHFGEMFSELPFTAFAIWYKNRRISRCLAQTTTTKAQPPRCP